MSSGTREIPIAPRVNRNGGMLISAQPARNLNISALEEGYPPA